MNDNSIEPIEAKVSELEPKMKSVNITFKVLSLGEERSVESRRDEQTHRVLDAVVGDSTATVMMPLWNETIDTVEEGTTYTLTNGYTNLFKGSLRLHLGKFGSIATADEPISDVNTEIDMSAEQHSSTLRR
jgi:replication factor A1